jgi:hypothetical protein
MNPPSENTGRIRGRGLIKRPSLRTASQPGMSVLSGLGRLQSAYWLGRAHWGAASPPALSLFLEEFRAADLAFVAVRNVASRESREMRLRPRRPRPAMRTKVKSFLCKNGLTRSEDPFIDGRPQWFTPPARTPAHLACHVWAEAGLW